MAPALDATKYIYEGIWINWTRGRVLGSTLTLNPEQTAIVSPALAILITIAGAQLWRLFQYALHQSRATPNNRNFLYHQTQTILRNTSTDLNALWRFIRLAIAWRHQRDAHLLKMLAPLMLWTFVHLALVIVAGVFSSWLLEANNDVLSISPWCGSYKTDYFDAVYATTYESNSSAVALSDEFNDYTNSRFALAQQSVDVCAAGQDHCENARLESLVSSAKFVRGGCPVNDSICHPDAGGSMLFETALLSSHTNLGYNSRKEDRISVKFLAQCAPLEAQGYVTDWRNVWDPGFNVTRQLSDAHYGVGSFNSRNATSSVTKQYPTCDEKQTEPPYLLLPQYSFPGPNGAEGTYTFLPIEELNTSTSDLNLILSSHQHLYLDPVLDPWFSAQRPSNHTNSLCEYQKVEMYTRQYPLTAMACTQQWQICSSDSIADTNSSKCTAPAGVWQTSVDVANLALSPRQQAIADRVVNTALTSSFYYVIYALTQASSLPLKVRYKGDNLLFTSVPPDQWKTETTYWMELVLAYFQQANLDQSTGQFSSSTDYINVTLPSSGSHRDPAQDATYWLCQNQIIQSKEYRNFNFFALCLTVVVCLFIIVLGLSIEDIVAYFRARSLRGSGNHKKQDTWTANSDLSMLRRIDELKSGTKWTISRNGIPLTHVGHTVSTDDLVRAFGNYIVEDGGIVMTDTLPKRGVDQDTLMNWGYQCKTCAKFDQSVDGSVCMVSRSGRSEQDIITVHN